MKISVVTPSYNQGWALERTIRSVLAQDCPHVEYIIVDGGSTDNSLDIIKKYEKHLAYWVSEPDRGQSHAINRGFERATGDIFCWLNSDDFFAPNALIKIINGFEKNPSVDVITAGWISYYSNHDNFVFARAGGLGLKPNKMLFFGSGALLGQHSTFWKKDVWIKSGGLNESYHYAMDHDLFCRFFVGGAKFKIINDYVAFFTLYDGQKSADVSRYAEESRRAKANIIGNHFFYNSNLNYLLVKFIRNILKHRDTHPSIGLTNPEPDFNTQDWLNHLQVS